MLTSLIISLCFGVALLLCWPRIGLSQVRPITEADAVVAIYTEDWGLMSSGKPKLLVGVWGDGHAVWSGNRIRGGPPYRSGFVEPRHLRSLFARLEHDGTFANKKLSRANFGPDSAFTVVFVKAGAHLLKMESWHELYEAGGKLIDTSGGLEPLDGRKREDVLQREPKDYQEYRDTWKRLRELASKLLPKESSPVQGALRMKAGGVLWAEEATEAKASKPKRE